MRLSKRQLATVAKFKSDEDSRYALTAYQVKPSGETQATNGHWLAVYKPALAETDETDAPVIPGVPVPAPLVAPVLVPQQVWADASKAVPKKCYVPILAGAFLRHNGEACYIATTDLELPRVQRFAPVIGTFPKTDSVIPSGEPVAMVTLDAHYLRNIADAAIAMQGAKNSEVRLQIYADAEHGPRPVTFHVKAEKDELLVVLMPVLMPRDGAA